MAFTPTSNVVATVTGLGQITVTWTNPPGTAWVDVWRATQNGSQVNIRSAVAVTASITDTAAPLGQQVRYLVYAGDGPRNDINWSSRCSSESSPSLRLSLPLAATRRVASRCSSESSPSLRLR